MAQYVALLGTDKTSVVVLKNTSAAPETTSNWAGVAEAWVKDAGQGQIVSAWVDVGPYSWVEEGHEANNSQDGFGKDGSSASNPEKAAQSFQVSSAISCIGVWVRLYKQGTPSDSVQVSIQADSSGDPSGTPLKSATKSSADIGTSANIAWHWFDWAAESLSASTTYWIVLERTGTLSNTNFYLCRLDTNAGYGNGAAESYYSSAWNTTTWDLAFRVSALDTADHLHLTTAQRHGRLAYHAFDPSADAWVVADEPVPRDVSEASDGAPDTYASCGVRSDGDVVALYNFDDGVNYGTRYARREGGGWTADVDVATEAATSGEGEGGVVVMGALDRAHFLYGEADDAVYHRSLSSVNALAVEGALTATKTAAVLALGRGVNDSADNVSIPFVNSSDSKALLAEFASAASPTITENSAVSDNTVETGITSHALVCCAVDGTSIWTVYANDADQDIYTDQDDGSDTEQVDAVACNRLSANVYTRSGQKLGIVYLDGTTIKYEEVDLAGALPGEVTEVGSFRVELPSEVTDAASVRVLLLGEVTDLASLRAALAGEQIETGSARIEVPSEVTDDASFRTEVPGEQTEAASFRAALPSEQTDAASARIAQTGEQTEAASLRTEVAGEVTDDASVRVEVPGEVTDDASARVAQTGEQTEQASARIALEGEVTDDASARIALEGEVTDDASARIALEGEVTDDASARIALEGEVTDDASARIALEGEATDDASARIALEGEVTDDASARIALEGEVTDDASARIASQRGEVTDDASARIAQTSEQTEAATTRVEVPGEVIEDASARIALEGEQTEAVSARIAQTGEQVETASAQISTGQAGEVTEQASARIALEGEQTADASLRAAQTGEQTEAGSARVAQTGEQTEAGSARIAQTGEQTEAGSARVALESEVSEDASFRAALPGEQTAAASARIAQTGEQVETASARIASQRGEVTEPASARVEVPGEQAIAASTRIAQTGEQAEQASFRAALPGEVTDDASARIAQTSEQTEQASARVEIPGEVTDDASIRIGAEGEQSADVSFRAALPSEQTEPASARIETGGEVAEPASARILMAGEITDDATIRIELPGDQTADASARIAQTGEQTELASARVAQTGEQTELASALLLLGSEQTDVGSGRFELPAIQTLIPGSDLSNPDVWRRETDSATTIYLSIDEGWPPIAADYIKGPGEGVVQISSGLLVQDNFTRANSDTPGGVWTEDDTDVDILSNQAYFTGSATADHALITAGQTLDTAFQQAFLRCLDNQAKVGLVARWSGSQTGSDGDGYIARLDANEDDLNLHESANSSESSLADGPDIVGTTSWTLNNCPIQFYTADGIQQAAAIPKPTNGWADLQTVSATDPTYDAANDDIGIDHKAGFVGDPNHAVAEEYLAFSSKDITMDSLGTNFGAKVIDDEGAEVASASESGGTATVDASLFGGANLWVPYAGWPEIIVTGPNGVEIESYQGAVYPGDAYSATGLTEPSGLQLVRRGLITRDNFTRSDRLGSDDRELGNYWRNCTGVAWDINTNRLYRDGGSGSATVEMMKRNLGAAFMQAAIYSSRASGNAFEIWGRANMVGYNSDDFQGVRVYPWLGDIYLLDSVASSETAIDSDLTLSDFSSSLTDFQLYLADSVQEFWIDVDSGATLSGTNTGHNGVTASWGFQLRDASTDYVDECMFFIDEKIVVTGMPTGWKAQIRNTVDSTVAEATESSGTATINCSMFDSATEAVPYAGWDAIIVTNASDVEQSRYDSIGIYPGSKFHYS